MEKKATPGELGGITGVIKSRFFIRGPFQWSIETLILAAVMLMGFKHMPRHCDEQS